MQPSRFGPYCTLANALTLSRIPLAAAFPPALGSGSRRGRISPRALAVVAVAGVTDVFDGIVARRSGRGSPLGNVLDPIADKTFAVVVLRALARRGLVPRWGALALLTREALEAPLVALSLAGALGLGHTRTPAANRLGKLATVAQFTAVATCLFAPRAPRVQRAAFALAGALGVAAGVSYWARALREARAARVAQ